MASLSWHFADPDLQVICERYVKLIRRLGWCYDVARAIAQWASAL